MISQSNIFALISTIRLVGFVAVFIATAIKGKNIVPIPVINVYLFFCPFVEMDHFVIVTVFWAQFFSRNAEWEDSKGFEMIRGFDDFIYTFDAWGYAPGCYPYGTKTEFVCCKVDVLTGA